MGDYVESIKAFTERGEDVCHWRKDDIGPGEGGLFAEWKISFMMDVVQIAVADVTHCYVPHGRH